MIVNRSIKAILFDFYQTLVDIKTDEKKIELWRTLASFLQSRGADVAAETLRARYFRIVEESLERSTERHPEVIAQVIFSRLLEQPGITASAELASVVAQLFRTLSIVRFQVFPEAREVLPTLAKQYRLGLVSDSQTLYLEPELRRTGLAGLFEVVVSSSVLGYRKPDPRMFQSALWRLNLRPDEVVYVGDSWERDVVGADHAGIQGIWVNRDAGQGEALDSASVPRIANLRELLSLLDPVSGRLCYTARGGRGHSP